VSYNVCGEGLRALYLEAGTTQSLLQSGSEAGIGTLAVVNDDARESNVASHAGTKWSDAIPDADVDDPAGRYPTFVAPDLRCGVACAGPSRLRSLS